MKNTRHILPAPRRRGRPKQSSSGSAAGILKMARPGNNAIDILLQLTGESVDNNHVNSPAASVATADVSVSVINKHTQAIAALVASQIHREVLCASVFCTAAAIAATTERGLSGPRIGIASSARKPAASGSIGGSLPSSGGGRIGLRLRASSTN